MSAVRKAVELNCWPTNTVETTGHLKLQAYRQQFTDLSNLVLGECSRTQLVLAILRHSDIDKEEPVGRLRGASATEVAKETKPNKGKKKR